MAKQTQKQVNEKEGKKMQAFLEAYDEAVLEVAKVHKMKMIPILQATEHGIQPVFGVQNVIEVDKRKDDKNVTPTDKGPEEPKG